MSQTNYDFPLFPGMNADYWNYFAEGFDSMIFSYSGPQDDLLTNKVIRLFKQPKNAGIAIKTNAGEREAHFRNRLIYNSRIISTVLDDVDIGIPYTITEEFIRALQTKSDPLRPKRRVQESSLQLNSLLCILHNNHCPPGSFTIEIKPKWGFRTTSPLVKEDSIRKQVSRFTMKQYAKMKDGQAASLCLYIPEDLFSKDITRITKAVNALVDNPQTFLKVWDDGKSTNLTPEQKDKLINVIYNMKHFDQLLVLQKLDYFDSVGARLIAKKAGEVTWGGLLSDEKIISGIHDLLNNKIKLPTTEQDAIEFIDKMDQETAKIFITAFLISTSAKDVSVMLTFKDRDHISDPVVSIVDFDMKATDKMQQRYFDKEDEIINAYLERKK